jgi:hypothetical protein
MTSSSEANNGFIHVTVTSEVYLPASVANFMFSKEGDVPFASI